MRWLEITRVGNFVVSPIDIMLNTISQVVFYSTSILSVQRVQRLLTGIEYYYLWHYKVFKHVFVYNIS